MSAEPAGPAPSVLTLVRGRRDHLRNLMRGLARQTRAPARTGDRLDAAGAGAGPARSRLPRPPPPRAGRADAAGRRAQPRRRARPPAISSSSSTSTASRRRPWSRPTRQAAATARGLFLGEVLYLPPGASAVDALDFGRARRARPRPSGQARRSRPPVCGRSPMPASSGACPSPCRPRWRAVGGMDEALCRLRRRGDRLRRAARGHRPADLLGRRARAPTTSTTRSTCRRCSTSTPSCATPRASAPGTGAGA